MEALEIVRAGAHESLLLQAIARDTFTETFWEHNSEEDMKAYLENSFSVKQIEKELLNPASEFYFAKIETRIIGYLKLNFCNAQTEVKQNRSMEIERIYVLKAFHGADVGKQLLSRAMVMAKQRKMDFVWLGVWEKNLRAIAFYRKNGFEEFDKHIFKLGSDEQTDILMRINLV